MRRANSYFQVVHEADDHKLTLLHFGPSKSVALAEAEAAACVTPNEIWFGALNDRVLTKSGNNPPPSLPSTSAEELESLLADIDAREDAIKQRDPVRANISARMTETREKRTELFKKGSESIEMAEAVAQEVAALDVTTTLLGQQYETESVWQKDGRIREVGALLDVAFDALQRAATVIIGKAEDEYTALCEKLVAALKAADRPAPRDFAMREFTGRGSRFALPPPYADGPDHLRRMKLEVGDLEVIRSMVRDAIAILSAKK